VDREKTKKQSVGTMLPSPRQANLGAREMRALSLFLFFISHSRIYKIYNISIVQFDTTHKFVSCRATEQTQLFIWKGELHAAMTIQKNKTEEMKKSVINLSTDQTSDTSKISKAEINPQGENVRILSWFRFFTEYIFFSEHSKLIIYHYASPGRNE
jgi:hypothetical protein